MEHELKHVQSGVPPGKRRREYRSTCECGWLSGWQPTESKAYDELDSHRLAMREWDEAKHG